MRNIKLSFSIAFISIYLTQIVILNGQITNGDFENWLTCPCNPPGWNTNNIYTPFEFILVSQGEPYAGNYGITGIVDSSADLAVIFPPLLISDRINLDYRPAKLEGFFKFVGLESDRLSITISLLNNIALLGQGGIIINENVEEYIPFSVELQYLNNDTPEYAEIGISILPPEFRNDLHIGSQFWLDEIIFSDTAVTSLKQTADQIKNEYVLYQNYPNPFNSGTTIQYSLPENKEIKIKIFNSLGSEIITLFEGYQTAGRHELFWDGKGIGNESLSSGVYYCNLMSDRKSITKPLVLLK